MKEREGSKVNKGYVNEKVTAVGNPGLISFVTSRGIEHALELSKEH